jgi:hypothetical protein
MFLKEKSKSSYLYRHVGKPVSRLSAKKQRLNYGTDFEATKNGKAVISRRVILIFGFVQFKGHCRRTAFEPVKL